MTRINCIPPKELTDKHLVAEYRELPRIFKLIRGWCDRHADSPCKFPTDDLPQEYRLGKGHVLFFYDKGYWLYRRQQSLIKEMKARGFNPKFTNPYQLFNSIPFPMQGDWVPTEEAMELNRERIRERLNHPAKRKPSVRRIGVHRDSRDTTHT